MIHFGAKFFIEGVNIRKSFKTPSHALPNDMTYRIARSNKFEINTKLDKRATPEEEQDALNNAIDSLDRGGAYSLKQLTKLQGLVSDYFSLVKTISYQSQNVISRRRINTMRTPE